MILIRRFLGKFPTPLCMLAFKFAWVSEKTVNGTQHEQAIGRAETRELKKTKNKRPLKAERSTRIKLTTISIAQKVRICLFLLF